MILAATRDAARLFLELGTVTIVLAVGARLAARTGMPATLLDTFFIAYPSKRFRSAWVGIAVHSAQSVVLAILILTLVI